MKKKDIKIYIKDEETFVNTYYNENYKKLLGFPFFFLFKFNQKLIEFFFKKKVVDIHPTWSGPCEMMFPTYQDLSSTIDDFDKRLDFIMVYQKLICKDLSVLKNSFLKRNSKATEVKRKKRNLVYTLKNNNYFFKFWIAASCRPKFLLILEGKIVDEVHGANLPELTEKIFKNIPFYSN